MIELTPIARVHSSVAEPRQMPRGGVPAEIEVFAPYGQGLDAIEQNSHLVLIGFFDRADRTKLVASPRPRGVFGIRSAVRPNPLGLTVARLVSVDGLRLRVDALDFLDGTPIVDIKRYAPGWDSVFSALTSHELQYRADENDRDALDDMMQGAARFHGSPTTGVAVAVRALRWAQTRWQVGLRDPRLTVEVGRDGAIADSLQALTGARFGDGRLKVGAGHTFAVTFEGETLRFTPRPAVGALYWSAALVVPFETLLSVAVTPGDGGGATRGPGDGRPE